MKRCSGKKRKLIFSLSFYCITIIYIITVIFNILLYEEIKTIIIFFFQILFRERHRNQSKFKEPHEKVNNSFNPDFALYISYFITNKLLWFHLRHIIQYSTVVYMYFSVKIIDGAGIYIWLIKSNVKSQMPLVCFKLF